MNLLDLLLILLFIGLFTLAFLSGTTRMLAALIALVVAGVAACIFYRPVARALESVASAIDRPVAEFVGFLAVAAIFWTGVVYLLLRSFRIVRLRSRAGADIRGGLLVSTFDVVLAFLIAVLTITLVLQVSYRTVVDVGGESIADSIAGWIGGSTLADQALRLTPTIHDVADAVTPGREPAILAPVRDAS